MTRRTPKNPGPRTSKPRARVKKKTSTPFRLGVIFVSVAGVAAVLLFQKAQLSAMLRPGESFEIEFSQAHRLRPAVSDVKIAGIPVGVVRSVDQKAERTSVEVKVDDDVLEKMGTAPTARIRPSTLLGGNYYVEIVPGGRRGTFEGSIPADRTELPVELGGISSAFPADARKGVKSSTKALDETLASGGEESLRALVKAAPRPLHSAREVLAGLQGTEPRRDLARLVAGLENASTVLSSRNADLGGSVDNLARVSRVLDKRRADLAEVTRTMPGTLDETTSMLDELDGVLTTLEKTAEPARPAVHELAKVLDRADPVLAEARPVVKELRGVLRDARPLVRTLVPTARDLDTTVDNVRGPVLDRVNGPILERLMNPWHGKGEYAKGGADRPLYKEAGYMLSNLAQANSHDVNGAMISFLPAVGPGSLKGLPISLEELFSAYAKEAQR